MKIKLIIPTIAIIILTSISSCILLSGNKPNHKITLFYSDGTIFAEGNINLPSELNIKKRVKAKFKVINLKTSTDSWKIKEIFNESYGEVQIKEYNSKVYKVITLGSSSSHTNIYINYSDLLNISWSNLFIEGDTDKVFTGTCKITPF